MHLKKVWSILKGTFSEFNEDKVVRLSAALAYYAMFSIGPLLVIALGLAGLLFGHESVRRQIEQQLQSAIGDSAARTLTSMMAAQKHGTGLITTIVGLVALLFGAAGVFGQLQDSLNTIWEVKSKPGAGIWGFIRDRFLSFSMVLGTGFLLLVSMALTTFLSAATGAFGSRLAISEALSHILNFAVSFAVVSLLFAMIFKYLPDIKVPFRKVWVGAIGTALLFTIGKYLLALYLGRKSTTSAYGAAGSVIVILMWVYYASLILFFGAEFTQVYARQTGAKILPGKYAVAVTRRQRAQEGIEPHSGATEQAGQPTPNAPGDLRLARPRGRPIAPGAVIRREPWQFLGMMLVAGFAGGVLLKFKSLRKGLRLLGALQKTSANRP
jgi:membrane protein